MPISQQHLLASGSNGLVPQVLKDLFHAEMTYTSTFAGGTQHPDRKEACKALSAAFVDAKTSRIREPVELEAALEQFMKNADYSQVAVVFCAE